MIGFEYDTHYKVRVNDMEAKYTIHRVQHFNKVF